MCVPRNTCHLFKQANTLKCDEPTNNKEWNPVGQPVYAGVRKKMKWPTVKSVSVLIALDPSKTHYSSSKLTIS